MEAIETPDISLKYYAELLEADPTNAVCGPARPNVRRVLMLSFFSKAIWERRISTFQRTGKLDKAVRELSQYLDTFYTDVEGWLELADIYASSNQ